MADPVVDSSGQIVQPRNITHVGGTAQTGRDLSADMQVLTDIKKGAQNADGISLETANVLKSLSQLMAYNGATLDRFRNNMTEQTILASAVRSANTWSANQVNYNARGGISFSMSPPFRAWIRSSSV